MRRTGQVLLSAVPGLRRAAAAWRRLRPFVGESRLAISALAAASTLSGLSEAAILALVAQVAAAMAGGDGTVHADLGPLAVAASVGTLLWVSLGFALARLALQGAIAFLPARVAADVQAALRKRLFAAFASASWEVQSQERDGHLQELMTSHIMRATEVVLQVANLFAAALMFVTLVGAALLLSVPVALLVIATAAMLFLALRPLARRSRHHGGVHSGAHVDYAAGVSETVRMAEEMQVFGTAGAHRRQVDALTDAARDPYFHTQFLNRVVPGAYQSLVILLILAGLAGLYVAGAHNLASLGAVVLILVRAAAYGQQLQGSYTALAQLMPYVDRLQAAERRYRTSAPDAGDQPLPAVEHLALDRVSFAYRPGVPVLREVSFAVAAGEAVGIVGPSGAGKSTLVQVLLRLRQPDDGAYLVNGQPAASFSRADWQRRVASVPQEPRLLHATVADNIRYLRALDQAAVRRAARLAHIHEDIAGWGDGYATVVGQRADAVSGGQRQRICLARALAARPEVVVLDEPTSALDLRSEALIQRSLRELKGTLTVFVVAHRLSTLAMCDRVMVLVDGRLEAFAAPAELARTNGFYREAVALSGAPSLR